MRTRSLFVVLLSALALASFAQSGPTVPTVAYDGGLQAALTSLGGVLGAIWPYIAAIAALSVGFNFVMKKMRGAGK